MCQSARPSKSDPHLKPNRLEAETLSGIALSGREDVAKVAAWFHQHGLNRLVLSMGGDGVYYSDISGESGWSAPIKTNVINVTGAGDAMMAGLASCWVDGMPFAESVVSHRDVRQWRSPVNTPITPIIHCQRYIVSGERRMSELKFPLNITNFPGSAGRFKNKNRLWRWNRPLFLTDAVPTKCPDRN